MPTLHTRRFVVPAIVLVLVYFLLSKLLIRSMTPANWHLVTYTPNAQNQLDQLALSGNSAGSTPSSTTLGVFSQIYVVSLLHRTERREQMERLRMALGLGWTYFPAVSSDNEVVHAVMQSVRTIREGCLKNDCAQAFAWPDEIDPLAASTAPLDLWNSDFLNSTDIPNLSRAWLENPPSSSLICAMRNFTLSKNTTQVKPHWLLTPARIACWHSHLSVIHLIANEERLDQKSSVLVLEDDVDMESDIQSQLSTLWPLLPREWDIAFLGHCWSNESTTSPLPNSRPFSGKSLLYPSKSPKCTHAYALTRHGARRLLLNLQYAPFAYSRAIDQAIAWLIESGRLNAYSVVPSLVVQRKVVESDVMAGNGSKWKDELRKGVLG